MDTRALLKTLRLLTVATCIVIGLTTPPAFAQSLLDPVAIALKQRGDDAIENGKYDEALDAYTRALAVEPAPALHYNRGRALQALNRNAEALEEFETFSNTASLELKAAVPELSKLVQMTRMRLASLALDCNVKEANLKIGNRVVPFSSQSTLLLDPGDYTFEILAPGYTTTKIQMTLRSLDSRQLAVELKKQDSLATLVIQSPVAGARVTVDGKTIGTAPIEISLPPGTHALSVSHPDFRDAETQIILKEREKRTVSIPLDHHPRIYERWWFWTTIGVVAAGGVVLGIALTTERSASSGDIPPGQITAPLVRF